MGDRAINLNQQLNEIETLFSTGHIKKAQKDLRKLNSQFGKDKPIPSKFRHKFQRLNFTAKEYDDWAEFATSDKRTELINEVKKLEAQKLEPRSLANKINSLQKQWQNLDQHGKTASKDKWSTFKEACEKAWAPCKDYFAVLETKKEENRDKKLGLLKDIETFPAGQDLNKKFKKARDEVNKLLEEVEIYNRKQKEVVIAEAEALDKEDIDASIVRIRELQDHWRTLGPAGKKLDPEINLQFETVCDSLLRIKDKELDESRGLMDVIIKELRDKKVSPSEAEQKFLELENLQGTQEEKRFKKAIKDFAILQRNEKAQEKLKSYQDLFEELIDNGSEKISKDLIPEFVNGKPAESMDLNEAAIRFQMFAGLDPVGPKEMVSRVKFEELRNRFTEKSVDMNEKLKEHFTNLVYSKGTSDKKESADIKKAMAKALKKVEELLP